MSPTKTATTEQGRYIEAIGRRKTAIARVRITPGSASGVIVNDKDIAKYFATEALRLATLAPFLSIALPTQFAVSAHVKGGGPTGQAEAIRLGISRALVEYNEDLRGELKKLSFLKRDPRAKERRKFGLKKARKAPQWSKR